MLNKYYLRQHALYIGEHRVKYSVTRDAYRSTSYWVLTQELIDEGLDLELSKEKLDRLLMARLMLPKEGQASQWTIDYLLGVYTRASDAKRNLGGMKDQALAKEMDDVCNAVQELAISHTNLALTLEIFPQVELLFISISSQWNLGCESHTNIKRQPWNWIRDNPEASYLMMFSSSIQTLFAAKQLANLNLSSRIHITKLCHIALFRGLAKHLDLLED